MFTRCRHILKTVRDLTVRNSLQDFDAIERYLHHKCQSILFQNRRKLFYFHHFQVFTRCRFQNVPVRVQFSKSTVFKMCRQKMCRFRVNGRPICHIFHRFQNVPASCERSLIFANHLFDNEMCPGRFSNIVIAEIRARYCKAILLTNPSHSRFGPGPA